MIYVDEYGNYGSAENLIICAEPEYLEAFESMTDSQRYEWAKAHSYTASW